MRANPGEALALVGDALAATHNPRALLPVILEVVIEATGARGGRVCERDEEVSWMGDVDGGDPSIVLELARDQDGETTLLLYAPEGGFNWGWTSMGPRHLRDVIAAPFRAAINEARAGAVMASYNEIDGLPLHGSAELLTDLLRGELGFSGVVVADYFGVNSLHSFHHCAVDDASHLRPVMAQRANPELVPQLKPELLGRMFR